MTSERIAFARSLRSQQTRAEAILWRRLRGSRFHGAKFKRQVPFDRYFVDFYCHAAKLAVEIDGRQHDGFAEYDRGRNEVLERLGVQVVRFSNEEVCGDLDAVLDPNPGGVATAIRLRRRSPHPFLSPSGREGVHSR